MVRIHDFLNKDKYFIVDRLNEVTGLINSVAYEITDDKVYIAYIGLSCSEANSTKSYMDTLNRVMERRKALSLTKIEFYNSYEPYIKFKK